MSTRTTSSSGKLRHSDLSAADLDDALAIPRGGLAKEAEHDAGQQSLEAAQRFESGLAFGLPALEVRAGARVPAALNDGELVQRGVELPVSVAVEPVALLLSRGGIERRHAGETRELRIGAKSADPAGLADELSGDQRSAALQVEELGAYRATRTATSRSSLLASTVSVRQRAMRSFAIRTSTHCAV
jgi:hypothetical protein